MPEALNADIQANGEGEVSTRPLRFPYYLLNLILSLVFGDLIDMFVPPYANQKSFALTYDTIVILYP